MRNVFVAGVLAFVTCGTSAGIIDSSAVDTRLGNGNRANLQGLQWLHLSETQGFSRDAIDGGVGNSYLRDGWRYATRHETETLVTSLWGGTYDGWSADNAFGARWFVNTFGPTFVLADSSTFTGRAWSRFYFGAPGECARDGFDVGYTCTGLLDASDDADQDFSSLNVLSGTMERSYTGNPSILEGVGWIREEWGADMGLDTNNTLFRTFLSLDDTASLLVRDVPSPGTVTLLTLGLACLVQRQRSRRGGAFESLAFSRRRATHASCA